MAHSAAPSRPAGRPVPPPKQSHIPVNSWGPGAPPTNRPGNEARDRDPKKSLLSCENQKPVPAPDNPQDPNPNPSQDLNQKARSLSRPQMANNKQGCEKTPSLPPPAQMWC
ncbi:hypothetical protein CHARACLAT_006220 [Characodon lateralis]|uniref:Uncharacterized protein n=1 Tax=Characodon lateralis TaxID=208331 RepID=A0ABU7F0W8_9TELE|nr:hypothetical protein [Characodon lateralis]